MGIPKDELQNLANTLEGDKDLNSPRELSAEAEKELAIVEKTIREAHVYRVNPDLKCILVILPSRHSTTGILMQSEDVILEWIFLPCKPNKKLKTYIEKMSDLIHKETVIWQPPDRWLSNDRITHYQAMLLNPEQIWFGTVTSLNRTTLLPEGGAEAAVEHNFLVGLMAEED
ncbi:hypothetical protein STEG23_038050 [Scotinomys teguina]